VTTPPLGSAAEEAARLFAAVEQWARSRAGGLLDEEHLATGSAECSVCPLCQTVHALRQVKPETVEHLLDAAASVVAALRSTVLGAPPDDPPPPSRSTVEHIDVREG
jgi:hypothetical protein